MKKYVARISFVNKEVPIQESSTQVFTKKAGEKVISDFKYFNVKKTIPVVLDHEVGDTDNVVGKVLKLGIKEDIVYAEFLIDREDIIKQIDRLLDFGSFQPTSVAAGPVDKETKCGKNTFTYERITINQFCLEEISLVNEAAELATGIHGEDNSD